MPNITIQTKKADAFKKAIFEAVEDETLKTWEIRESADDSYLLTHKPEQWADRALLKFIVDEDNLVIKTTKWKSRQKDAVAENYFIGRFIEILLQHFSTHFTDLKVNK
ncbi:hypothetical protein CKK33_06555 [Mucilaginibacter sp. MD40]|uniref:hypothetical protein n=1 Tax=Mucilaginibacter sp. MD40 TaxID=2029590 RepID=UPI000BACD317|nr:hypothetical protein [Mucilaginibacter sp. MD40]PAW93172.1 hypothetical protein CKK33_06555 [Mucilaginibacter sp. MD40]